MKHFFTIVLFFLVSFASAQAKLQMTPQGFQPLEVQKPNRMLDKLIERSKSWAPYYNKKGYDTFEVTENSLTIEARIDNAFHYYNVGEKFNHDIRYTLKILFLDGQKYTLTFTVKEIYADNVLLKTTTSDFFTPEGKLKEDFKEAKLSLENTANKVVNSFVDFIAR